ncbi:MAG TPA: translation initiation factor [Flavobacteriales bacterium]|nr:translation initiation factor [Flavobacteriales bacterium]HIA13167.1 translation initiation factor [Flavobacteriales bacterium]HIO71898.1 translation initiation factor [Flavobacteriales bacterium]
MGKKRGGLVYSTNPNFKLDDEEDDAAVEQRANKETLWVHFEKKHRAGKKVTLVSGFKGTMDQMKALGKLLKQKCGVGGSVKDAEILIQGNLVEKVKAILKAEGYGVKG